MWKLKVVATLRAALVVAGVASASGSRPIKAQALAAARLAQPSASSTSKPGNVVFVQVKVMPGGELRLALSPLAGRRRGHGGDADPVRQQRPGSALRGASPRGMPSRRPRTTSTWPATRAQSRCVSWSRTWGRQDGQKPDVPAKAPAQCASVSSAAHGGRPAGLSPSPVRRQRQRDLDLVDARSRPRPRARTPRASRAARRSEADADVVGAASPAPRRGSGKWRASAFPAASEGSYSKVASKVFAVPHAERRGHGCERERRLDQDRRRQVIEVGAGMALWPRDLDRLPRVELGGGVDVLRRPLGRLPLREPDRALRVVRACRDRCEQRGAVDLFECPGDGPHLAVAHEVRAHRLLRSRRRRGHRPGHGGRHGDRFRRTAAGRDDGDDHHRR